MDRFLLSYGLDPVAARRHFAETGAVLSGSSALALYLEQEGVAAGFEPNDMDLWLDGTRGGGEAEVDVLVDFLVRSGYARVKDKREADVYMEHLTRIQRVVTMESQGGGGGGDKKRVIQLIVVTPNEAGCVIGYLIHHFDFSACMTWWDEDTGRFETVYPALTRAKTMFVRRVHLSSFHEARAASRLEKYLSRGFTVVDEPPPFWVAADERKEEDLAVWAGVQAFDVWLYEEVGAAEHLAKGEWKVLVGCGGSWYAFDRRPLITYMEEHGGIQGGDRGTLYDTPYRQTVVYDAWDALAYGDYSVYELVKPETVVVRIGDREETKTVYGMRAYSMAGWRRGEAVFVVGTRTELRRLLVEGEDPVEQEDGDEDEELLRVMEESLVLGVEVANAEERGVEALEAEDEVLPLPDVPIEPLSREDHDALYHQLMEWFQVEPQWM
jgi:hypothetical protein